jgi:hypothetical protein
MAPHWPGRVHTRNCGNNLTHRGSLGDPRGLPAGATGAAGRATLASETGRFSGGQIHDVKNRLPLNSEAD